MGALSAAGWAWSGHGQMRVAGWAWSSHGLDWERCSFIKPRDSISFE